MFRGLKPLRTHYRVNGGASLVGRKVILPTNAPTRAAALLKQPCPPLHLPMGWILFLVTARQNYVHGKVNHVAVEEAQEAPDVVIGTFPVNDISVVVLFDSRA
jgi:hypothetical protein